MSEPKADPLPTFAELFQATVARVPAAEAVRSAEGALTYAALSRAAEALAAELPRGAIIALAHPRGPEQMIALIAVLRAGSTVLPLDPSYPADLRAFMLADAKAARILGGDPSTALSPSDSPQPSLAYLLYTSGSTGRPKGVAMPHRALANLLAWQRRTLPLREGARVLQFAPLSFDVSFQEILSTWAEGGTLVLIDEATRHDPRALWRVLAEEKIERVFLPYVALQLLAEYAPTDLPITLRDVITAGEQLRITPQIRSLFLRLPDCRLHNHYGPTETHVCTAYTLPTDTATWPLLPPIGRAIDGATLLLRDGELHVGGACLADGYFGRPELTAERFVEIDGTRYYRTGDLVQENASGELEFLGRADDQLKVRGFRLEPGEIEAQLAQHPAIRQCAVTARDQRLLAYWVGEPVEPAALRAHLAARLAPHLLPSIFTHLETMPLTPSGKINRRALPEPATPSASAHAAPTTLAGQIAAVWSEVLCLPSIDPAANFFDLGGTSLTAITAQQVLGSKLQRELPVTLLFQYPSIQTLARHLEVGAASTTLTARAQQRAAAQRAARPRPTGA